MTEPSDPILGLMDIARALRELARGLSGVREGGGAMPGSRPGLAFLLTLLADRVDNYVDRLDAN